MSRTQKIFLVFSSGSLEFYWLYGLILFLTYLINKTGLPVLSCFLIFWIAAGLSFIVRNRRMYVFILLFLYAITYAICVFSTLFIFYRPESNILNMVIIIFAVTLLYIAGFSFGKIKLSYAYSIKQLEIGIGMFFFIALMLTLIKIDIPNIQLYMLLFFLWGTISIALNKSSNWGNGIDHRNSNLKLIFFFTTIVCISIITIITFLTDYMKWAAGAGVAVAKAVTKPLIPYFLAFIKLFFGGFNVLQDSATTSESIEGEAIQGNYSSQPDLITGFLGNILLFAIGIVALIAVFVLLKAIVKILFMKKGEKADNRSLKGIFFEIALALKTTCRHILNVLKALFVYSEIKESKIERAYKKLIRWGSFRGIYYEVYETPYEYIKKLSLKYDSFQSEFNKIAEYYCKEIYGEKQLNSTELISIKNVFKSIRWVKPF